jgi:cytochrome c oxidase subunit 2
MVHCDFPTKGQILFQDTATPSMEGIVSLHHDIMFTLVFIAACVFSILFELIRLFSSTCSMDPVANIVRDPYLELIWTILPAGILSIIAVPSFALIYALDEIVDPVVTIKVIGHQWFWSYEISDFVATLGPYCSSFDSYCVTGYHSTLIRMMSVDNPLVIPVLSHIRVVISSTDVLHCWAVPSLGVKLDAAPGRLNQSTFFLLRAGSFYGMCSEICGVNHGYMPIEVIGITLTLLDNMLA